MKRFLALVLCAVCLCTSAFAATAATGSAKIGGKNVTTVTVKAGDIGSTDVALAYGSISGDQSAQAIVDAAAGKGELLVAVNGGFFNAYHKTAPEPGYGDAARCQVNLVRNGMAINGCGGDQTAIYLGFTKDGKALIDEVGVTLYVEHNGRKWPTWGVNNYYPDEPNSLLLFTPEAGVDLPVPANAKAAKIVNGKVTEFLTSGKMTCAENTYYFVAGKNLYDRLPSLGDAVTFSTEFDKSAWKDVTTAVACGPWLLHNGRDVFDRNSKYGYLSDQKVSKTTVATRTVAAILPSGDLMLTVCAASPEQIIAYLASVGATDAMLLDGGASSMLYANGRMLNSAGRELNNVIAIYGAKAPELSVTVGGAEVEWIGGSKPFIDANSRTMVPLRAVGNALDLTVDWNADTREASFSDGSKTIYFPIDKSAARTSDGRTIQMNTSAVIVNNSTYAPVRYLAEYFGRTVDWDGGTRTVIIK